MHNLRKSQVFWSRMVKQLNDVRYLLGRTATSTPEVEIESCPDYIHGIGKTLSVPYSISRVEGHKCSFLIYELCLFFAMLQLVFYKSRRLNSTYYEFLAWNKRSLSLFLSNQSFMVRSLNNLCNRKSLFSRKKSSSTYIKSGYRPRWIRREYWSVFFNYLFK